MVCDEMSIMCVVHTASTCGVITEAGAEKTFPMMVRSIFCTHTLFLKPLYAGSVQLRPPKPDSMQESTTWTP